MTVRDEIISGRVALLDTTVQVDRQKTDGRKRRMETMLQGYDFAVTTSICLLEFKATVIQECITIHNQLYRRQRFTEARDSLLEKKWRQTSLRAHIFNNLLGIGASSFHISEEDDRRLAEQAQVLLENVIPQLYEWFVHESVGAVLKDRTKCTRADESPTKKQVAFAANLPVCQRGKNKQCRIEEFIRQRGPELLAGLRQYLRETSEEKRSEQLARACEVFESVQSDSRRQLSHKDCRRAGDCLIALEAESRATHALSTNAAEWAPLSELLGFDFVRVDYPEERTR